MPDIEKLKQEAEEARQEAIKQICYIHRVDLYSPSSIADAIIAATIKQIALQAAEKEAEGKFPVYLHLQENGSWKMEPLNGMPNGGVTPVEYTAPTKAKAADRVSES